MLAFFGVLSLAGVALCLILLLVALVRKRRKAPALIGLAVCAALFAVCLVLTPPQPQTAAPLPTPSLSPSQSAKAPETLPPAPTPSKTTPPAPTPSQAIPSASPTPDYADQLAAYQSEVEQAATDAMTSLFDESADRSVSFTPSTGALLIEAQGSDNMSVKLIRAAMLADIRDVMAALSGFSGAPPAAPADVAPALPLDQVMFSIRFPLGGEVPIVLKATFTGEELRAADWSAMDSDACEKAATEFWTAAAFN